MSSSITVLIIDDHTVVRQGVRALLGAQEDIEVVGEAGSGEQALELAREHAPDVALMDLMMPGIGGIEATRRLKEVSPRTQILMLTSYHEDEHILPALRAGALSYLLKDASADELVQAVRKAASGEATLSPQVASQVVRSLRQPTREREIPPLHSQLSERERQVLLLVADGLTNTDIAQRLGIGEKTVKSHVSNILGKLQVEDRTQAAAFAWREGLKQR
ncbi:response regulator [Cystobacter ferrugineus]|jgi:NarL family two-component system response regulator LiaR|uniref:DNA-binding response regulator n=1 Tax=Cystobacter ferrugineus TaxID=83449 RepID=A0A1L9B429_9BACT|nr:response regulator transcription factor [Cystobacter ferrugineus]OJH36986.1 DNA-binding response regulator [Cystobacter ferrugineus]